MMWEEKVKRTEMSLFQEEFVRRGLRLVHDAPDQVNPAVDTCIGYAAVPCRFWVRSDRPNIVYDGNPRNRSRPSVRRNIVKIRRNIVEKHRNIVGKRRNVVGTRRNS